jgi:hypothetical protein
VVVSWRSCALTLSGALSFGAARGTCVGLAIVGAVNDEGPALRGPFGHATA